MKKSLLLLSMLLSCTISLAEEEKVWDLRAIDGDVLTQIAIEPSIGDEYIAADNVRYEIVDIQGHIALAQVLGTVTLPSTSWRNGTADVAVVMTTKTKVGIYCTHSDESYEPSDGYYSTRDRGSIYQVAHALSSSLEERGIDVTVSDQLHHPHDAGAYRRSRQTAVQLLKSVLPDCLIDIHRDGIPDPGSYAVAIDGSQVAKVRLLVGRGNQNAAVNKEFALMIKAIADERYPGLIKDIYMGKGTFNQDLLPHSILLECGTYTLEKEKVLSSMPMMADVLDLALNSGAIGSISQQSEEKSTEAQNDTIVVSQSPSGVGNGFGFLSTLLGIGIVGLAVLSAGSWKTGRRKASRNLHEMTGGLIGRKPRDGEDHQHS